MTERITGFSVFNLSIIYLFKKLISCLYGTEKRAYRKTLIENRGSLSFSSLFTQEIVSYSVDSRLQNQGIIKRNSESGLLDIWTISCLQ